MQFVKLTNIRSKLSNEISYNKLLFHDYRIQKSLKDLAALTKISDLVSVLFGQSVPTYLDYMETTELFFKGLNPSQKEAVDFVLRANHLSLLHGPPGNCV